MTPVAIIINNKAKNAANAETYLNGFAAANIPYTLYSVEPDQLDATLKQCVSHHAIVLIGGGDGTIRTGAQHCAHTKVILGVLPLGTLNHFAKELGLPQQVDEIVTAIKKESITRIDLAEVNGLVFINNSSLGFYPKFADKRDYYSKSYNKWLSYIPSFIASFKKHKVFNITIKSKQLNLSIRTSFLTVSNNLYTYEFPLTIKREGFIKEELGLYFFKQGRIQAIKIIKNFFNAKKSFAVYQSTDPIELAIADESRVSISLDGDSVKVNTPLLYKSLPKALTILTTSSCA